jgi:hypothetical protein
LVKTIDILTKFCGKKPLGFTSPAWKNSPDQIELLERLDIQYGQLNNPIHNYQFKMKPTYLLVTDHSFMHDDFQAYYVSTGKEEMITTDYKQHPETWMSPMKHAAKSKVVEIPASWTLDDWPPFQWDAARPNAASIILLQHLLLRGSS